MNERDWRLDYIACEHLGAMSLEEANTAHKEHKVRHRAFRICCETCYPAFLFPEEVRDALSAPSSELLEDEAMARTAEVEHEGFLLPRVEVHKSYLELIRLTEDALTLREIGNQAFHDWRLARKVAEDVALLAGAKAGRVSFRGRPSHVNRRA